MATNTYLRIYSNDGSTLLFTSTTMTSTNDEGAVTSTGFEFTVNSGNGTEAYTYSGNLKFLGFSTSANKTTPDYAIGDTIGALGGGVSVLYIVEEEAATGVTIKYKATTISIKDGQTITLHTTDKKFTEDLEVITSESTVEDWDGTIVVEGGTISFTIDGTSYEAEKDMTWEQWVESEYNTGGFYIVSTHTIQNGSIMIVNGDFYSVYSTDIIIADYNYIGSTGGSN